MSCIALVCFVAGLAQPLCERGNTLGLAALFRLRPTAPLHCCKQACSVDRDASGPCRLPLVTCALCVVRACSLPAEAGPFEKVVPRSDGKGRAWSDTSDFISTRDSFSSLDEEGYNNSMGGAHAAAQPAQAAAAGVVLPSYAVADGQQAAQQVQGMAAPRPSAAVPVSAAQQGQGQGLQAPPRPSSAQAQAPPHQQLHQQALRQSPPQAQPGLPVGWPGAGPGAGQGAGGAPVAVRSASSDGALPRPVGVQWDRRDAPGGAGDPDPGAGAGATGGGGQAEDGANGLWRSWWPRRLMPSWSSSEREKAKQKGEARAEGQAQGPPAQGQDAQAASQQQQQQQQRMDAGGQVPGQAGEPMAPKAGTGLQPGQRGGTGQQGGAVSGSGAAPSAQQGARGAAGGRAAGTGSAADDEGADFGGELHEVCAWVHGQGICCANDIASSHGIPGLRSVFMGCSPECLSADYTSCQPLLGCCSSLGQLCAPSLGMC